MEMLCIRLRHPRTLAILSRTASGIAFLALAALTLAMRKGIILPAVKTGFYCGDASLRYPIKEETAASKSLLFGGLVLIFVQLALTEWFGKSRGSGVKEVASKLDSEKDSGAKRRSVSAAITATFKGFYYALFGLCATVFMTELGKRYAGVLRPNFLAVCQPDVDCAAEDPLKFHEDYVCRGNDQASRKSFPSGHAAFIAYLAVFIAYHAHLRPLPSFPLMTHAVSVAAASVAWVTGLSRLTDYIHHPGDIVAGYLLGGFVAVWVLRTCFATAAASEVTGEKNEAGNECDVRSEEGASGHHQVKLHLSPRNCLVKTSEE